MNYYEELGLPREASVQEIRQAYKLLARLVHPDGQADPQVRGMAERQMRRLNEILATLSSAHSRRAYDESLMGRAGFIAVGSGAAGPPIAVPAKVVPMRRMTTVVTRPEQEPWRERLPEWATRVLGYWFWIALAAGVFGVGCWYVAAGNSSAAGIVSHRPAAVFASYPASPSFAGHWLSVPEAVPPSAPGTYVATYVELLVTEDHGELWGLYRARYKGPERSAAPEVSFRAQGQTPSGDSARLDWTSTEGARGEMEIARSGPNRMNVRWWTTGSGGSAMPESGTARLIRQPAP